MPRPLGKHKGVLVPVKHVVVAGQACKEGVGHPLRRELRVKKTDFSEPLADNRGTQRVGQHLPPQANPKEGDIQVDRAANERSFLNQVGEPLISCVLRPPHGENCAVHRGIGKSTLRHHSHVVGDGMLLQQFAEIARWIDRDMLER